jgi:hypothetical protein
METRLQSLKSTEAPLFIYMQGNSKGEKCAQTHFRGTTLFHHHLTTAALWMPIHPNSITGVPGTSYSILRGYFTSAAHKGASGHLRHRLAPTIGSLKTQDTLLSSLKARLSTYLHTITDTTSFVKHRIRAFIYKQNKNHVV